MNVLGIEVDADLLAQWRDWFAPAVQPFRVVDLPADVAALLPADRRLPLSDEIRDTFFVYSTGWCQLSAEEFAALPLGARRALAHTRAKGHRRIWWPADHGQAACDRALVRYVEEGVNPSVHREVSEQTWQAAGGVLPGARALAGTFAVGSGPNCFGTVMGAAGVPGAENEWMFQEPFEEWLAATTEPARGRSSDQDAGTVLVWRDAEGLAQHAAVTLGGGWVLNKPSQSWSSPRLVWDAASCVRRCSYAGQRLERHRIRV